MTLQQLKYITALDHYRNFAKAAEACGVTQPTLSGMLMKLEEELDVRIFDRNNKTVTPTSLGARIVRQAEHTLVEAGRIREIVEEARGSVSGRLALGVGPSVAPYILPQFIKYYIGNYPQVELTVEEMKAIHLFDALQRGQIDAGIAISGNARQDVLEIPLYTERFWVYLSDKCWRKLPVFKPENLENENMWIMKDAQCLRESAFSFCKAKAKGHHVYEAGSIDTLIRIVDINGGYTIIPEMHLPLLTDRQRENVRRIDGDRLSYRRVSLYVRDDYVREKMLNTVTSTLVRFMPKGMMEPNIEKYGVRL